MENYYKILGVHRDSTDEEVRDAYIALAKKLHPDMPRGNAEEFVKINGAYRLLNDRKLKSDYLKEVIALYRTCLDCGGSGTHWISQGFGKPKRYKVCHGCDGIGHILKKNAPKPVLPGRRGKWGTDE